MKAQQKNTLAIFGGSLDGVAGVCIYTPSLILTADGTDINTTASAAWYVRD